MSFNRNSRLDPSQVEDRRGQRGRGTAIAVGGGGIGLIITINAWTRAGYDDDGVR